MYIFTFYEPRAAMIIEDKLVKLEIESEIIRTPLELLDADCFYCKTALCINTLKFDPMELRELPLASLYSYNNLSYVQIDLTSKQLEGVS